MKRTFALGRFAIGFDNRLCIFCIFINGIAHGHTSFLYFHRYSIEDFQDRTPVSSYLFDSFYLFIHLLQKLKTMN